REAGAVHARHIGAARGMVQTRPDDRRSERMQHLRIRGRDELTSACGIAIDIEMHMRTRTGADEMAEYDEHTSIPGLIKGLLDDARDLIREELQLARAEIREEISALQTVTIAFAVAAVVGLLGVM